MDFNKLSKLEKQWIEQATSMNKTIVLPEAGFSERTVLAGIECSKSLCDVVFLVKNDDELKNYDLANNNRIKVVNITNHELTPVIASAYYIKRQSKGITEEQAAKEVQNVYIYGAMMVELGLVDGMVAGAEAPSKDVFGAAFKTVKAKTGKASSFFVMIPEKDDEKAYVLSDCGVMLNPTSEELAEIAVQSAESYRKFVGQEPKVALLCYSTHGSADGDCAEKVRAAVRLLNDKNVDFIYDGEIQLDASIVPGVASKKCPTSPLKGDANVLVFPDLQSGNIGYKLMQRFGGFKAVGPIIQGLNKPINDLSRGTTVDEIVLSAAITILQI